MYYVVMSPRNEDYDWLEELLLTNPDRHHLKLAVKELGDNGNHPHLNLILDSRHRRTQELNRMIKTMIKRKKPDFEISKNLIMVKNIFDLDPLIGNYLQKEDSCQILYQHPEIDINAVKHRLMIANNYRGKKYRWKYVPTFMEFPLFYEDYCKNNMLCPENFRTNLSRMAAERIAIHHLLRRKDELWWAISAIVNHGFVLEKTPEINFWIGNIGDARKEVLQEAEDL